ncbi:MAG: hypothetical protein II916_07135 [Oscillospiraceae bacterium]|nr:hypothetical protein [Oscillospiraceae bacterium]
MKKTKWAGILLAAVMTISAGAPAMGAKMFGMGESASFIQMIDANAADGRRFNQNEKQWKNGYYYYGKSRDTLYNAGCGIFALGNAVYALNGNTVDIRSIATWASNNGSWRPGSGGLCRQPFYDKITGAYGGQYGFKVTSTGYGNVKSKSLINHLSNGGVAVVHVKNHFIAITGYNASNRTYHVIESAVYSGRNLPADSWQGITKLSRGNTNVDWYCLISNTSKPTKYFPRYTGNSSSIVVGLQAVGANSSYDYRQKIYERNMLNHLLGKYRGTATQNTAMLRLLKAGQLMKP